jgi:peptidoglycan-N-acetylglucosamine deacetylase
MPEGEPPRVYLTFDDGPDPVTTPAILDLLKTYQAKATFFPVGITANEHPALIEAIRAAGHRVHLHSWNHQKMWRISLSGFKEDVRKCNALLGSRLYRPPYGKMNPFHLFWLHRNGYRVVLWSVNSRDYQQGGLNAASIMKAVAGIRNGDIILLHNKYPFQQKTIHLTQHIIKHITAKGFIFSTID